MLLSDNANIPLLVSMDPGHHWRRLYLKLKICLKKGEKQLKYSSEPGEKGDKELCGGAIRNQ